MESYVEFNLEQALLVKGKHILYINIFLIFVINII